MCIPPGCSHPLIPTPHCADACTGLIIRNVPSGLRQPLSHLLNRKRKPSSCLTKPTFYPTKPPKESAAFYLGLSGRALSGGGRRSGRSVCCLSEASFRRDSVVFPRSSPNGSALIFWLLLDQAKSNDSLRPKRAGVKRRGKTKRQERLLSERSEFQTRQRSLSPEQPERFSLDLLVTFGSSQK